MKNYEELDDYIQLNYHPIEVHYCASFAEPSASVEKRSSLKSFAKNLDILPRVQKEDVCYEEAECLANDTFELEKGFQKRLFELIDERGLKDSQVYKPANVDRRVFSKIRVDADYHPAKDTVLALVISLKLNMKDARDLLSRAGYAFNPSDLKDVIVCYYIEKEEYNLSKINLALYDHHASLIGK